MPFFFWGPAMSIKCLKCHSSELFYFRLERLVHVHTLGGSILDIVADDEGPAQEKVLVCVEC